MYRTPHSTGIANQGVNTVDENLEDVELDSQSDPGTQTDYPIALISTTGNSKMVQVKRLWLPFLNVPARLNIVVGQYSGIRVEHGYAINLYTAAGAVGHVDRR